MKFSKYFDHTILKGDVTSNDINKLCREAKEYDFASVCVNPSNIRQCKQLLEGTNIDICTVVGFPLGAMTTESKIFETKQAIEMGATEIDMVINIGKLKDREYEYVKTEIKSLKEVCGDKILKVIIETCLLTDEEKIKACELAKEAEADFIKTSTGMSTSGAKVEDIVIMKKIAGNNMGVKASGGIKTLENVKTMLEAGADRIGCSLTVEIIKNMNQNGMDVINLNN